MAFPNTPILDSFDRISENPLSDGGLWYPGTVAQMSATLQTNGTQALNASGVDATSGGQAWGVPFAAPAQVYVTFAVLPATLARQMNLVFFDRQHDTQANGHNGYRISTNNGGTGTISIIRFTFGSSSTTPFTQTALGVFAAGDVVGMSITADTAPVITLFRNGTQLAQYTDTSGMPVGTQGWPAGTGHGYIGIDTQAIDSRFENFGGGSLVTAHADVNVNL